MARVRVAGVAKDTAGQHVILLKPIDAGTRPGRVLPVWIGAQEAASILVAVQGVTPPRPLTHDLVVNVLQVLHGTVERVDVTRLDGGTFYAEITLHTPEGVRRIDARPSDAIALASRTEAGIWVADDVLAEAGVDDVMTDAIDDDGEVDEFRRFLEGIDPDDFRADSS